MALIWALLWALAGLLPGTQAGAVRQRLQYDVAIVGGGPAGLSAVSGLARVRRKAVLFDSGEYRNDAARRMHDVLGFDGKLEQAHSRPVADQLTSTGVTPAFFRWTAREHLKQYETVDMFNGTVTKITPAKNNCHFRVTTAGGRTVEVRKVVLATGLRDVLPETPGVRENWGRGIYWCAWCDGYEHADQPLGVLGSIEYILPQVREILTLNSGIVAFVNGTDTPDAREEASYGFPLEDLLRLYNIRIDNRTITAITRLRDGSDDHTNSSLATAPERDLFRVDFTEGPSVMRAAFIGAFPTQQRSRLGEETGVWLYDGRLAADIFGGLITNIQGIYAIGDANSNNVTNVPHAVFSGKRTAVHLHRTFSGDSKAGVY